jgi:hypothetical protein
MNLHDDAVEFVRLNGCAQSTPVELIEAAMNYGANKMAEKAISDLSALTERLKKKHKESAPHQETKIPLSTLFI